MALITFELPQKIKDDILFYKLLGGWSSVEKVSLEHVRDDFDLLRYYFRALKMNRYVLKVDFGEKELSAEELHYFNQILIPEGFAHDASTPSTFNRLRAEAFLQNCDESDCAKLGCYPNK